MKYIFAFIFLPIFMSCNNQKDRIDNSKILKATPYTEITDSIKKFPKNEQLYINRGILLTKNNQLEIATNDFENAWQIKPTAETAAFYATSLMRHNKYDTAIIHLKKTVTQFPTNLFLKELLGKSYQEKNKYAEALKIYDAMLSIDSLNLKAHTAKGFCYQELKNDNAAIKAFEMSYSITPTTLVSNELADMYAETKNEKTISFCKAILKTDTAKDKNVQPLYCIGRYYRNIGNNVEAKKIFEECIRKDYTFSYAYLDKAEILIDEKKYTECISILNIAKENDNQNADVYYLMGKCLEATNKTEDAKIEYQRAIALDKEFTSAKEALEKLKK